MDLQAEIAGASWTRARVSAGGTLDKKSDKIKLSASVAMTLRMKEGSHVEMIAHRRLILHYGFLSRLEAHLLRPPPARCPAPPLRHFTSPCPSSSSLTALGLFPLSRPILKSFSASRLPCLMYIGQQHGWYAIILSWAAFGSLAAFFGESCPQFVGQHFSH